MMLSYYCGEKQATSQPIVLGCTALSFKGPLWQSTGALSRNPNGFRGCDCEGHVVLQKLNMSEFFVTSGEAVVASWRCLLFLAAGEQDVGSCANCLVNGTSTVL